MYFYRDHYQCLSDNNNFRFGMYKSSNNMKKETKAQESKLYSVVNKNICKPHPYSHGVWVVAGKIV